MPFVSSHWRVLNNGDPHYLVLHATSMIKFYLTVYYFQHSLTQMSFIYCHLNFHANLLRPWRFPLNSHQRILMDMFTFFNFSSNFNTDFWKIIILIGYLVKGSNYQNFAYLEGILRPICMLFSLNLLSWELPGVYRRISSISCFGDSLNIDRRPIWGFCYH